MSTLKNNDSQMLMADIRQRKSSVHASAFSLWLKKLTDRGTDNWRGMYGLMLFEFSSRKENVIHCLQQYFYHPILFSSLPPNTFCLSYTSLSLVQHKITSFMSRQVPQGSCVTLWSDWELLFGLHLIILLAATALMPGTLGLLGKPTR